MSSISSGMYSTMKPLAAGSPSGSNYSGGPALPSISSALSSPVTGPQAQGSQSYGGTALPQPALPNPSATPTAAQNAANAASADRLNQGMGVLAGGFNGAKGSIADAMNVSGQYQNAALGAASNQAGAYGAGMASQLGGVGITANMAPLAGRVEGWADQNINEQANSRQAGLDQNQGQLSAQGGQAMGNYLGSANIQGPNIAQDAQLEQQAAQQQSIQQALNNASAASRSNALAQANAYLNPSSNAPPAWSGAGTDYSPSGPAGYTQGAGSGSQGQYDPSSAVPFSLYNGSPASTAIPPSTYTGSSPAPINISPGSPDAVQTGSNQSLPGANFSSASTQLPPGTFIGPDGTLQIASV